MDEEWVDEEWVCEEWVCEEWVGEELVGEERGAEAGRALARPTKASMALNRNDSIEIFAAIK